MKCIESLILWNTKIVEKNWNLFSAVAVQNQILTGFSGKINDILVRAFCFSPIVWVGGHAGSTLNNDSTSGVFRISKREGPNFRWPLVLTQWGKLCFPSFPRVTKHFSSKGGHGPIPLNTPLDSTITTSKIEAQIGSPILFPKYSPGSGKNWTNPRRSN